MAEPVKYVVEAKETKSGVSGWRSLGSPSCDDNKELRYQRQVLPYLDRNSEQSLAKDTRIIQQTRIQPLIKWSVVGTT